jgi:hypothetical protein
MFHAFEAVNCTVLSKKQRNVSFFVETFGIKGSILGTRSVVSCELANKEHLPQPSVLLLDYDLKTFWLV